MKIVKQYHGENNLQWMRYSSSIDKISYTTHSLLSHIRTWQECSSTIFFWTKEPWKGLSSFFYHHFLCPLAFFTAWPNRSKLSENGPEHFVWSIFHLEIQDAAIAVTLFDGSTFEISPQKSYLWYKSYILMFPYEIYVLIGNRRWLPLQEILSENGCFS
jgi:hypothetical protein